MSMIIREDKLNCGKCAELWRGSIEDAKQYPKKKILTPKCWHSFCHNSKYQFEGLDLWISMMLRLKSSEVISSTGLGRELLEWADALDMDTVETLCQLESIWNKLIAQKREADSRS